jgi:hypothetical protein
MFYEKAKYDPSKMNTSSKESDRMTSLVGVAQVVSKVVNPDKGLTTRLSYPQMRGP